MRKVLVLADWTDWENDLFLRHYPHRDDSVTVIRTRLAGSYEGHKRAVAWIKYFLLALGAFHVEREYDVVVVWQQVIAYFLGSLRRLSRKPRPPMLLLGFIWSRKRRSFANALRRALVRTAMPETAVIVCYSRGERAFCVSSFAQPESKVRFIPLGMDFPFRAPDFEEGYVVSAGKSGRDYQTLLQAARMIEAPFKVIAPRRIVEGLDAPANIDFVEEVNWESFASVLGSAKVVVIPLEEEEKTAGQLVLLQSMHLGRAVVVTRARGVEDYVEDGVNGIIVEPHAPERLAGAILRLLGDAVLRRSLGTNARHDAVTRCSSKLFWVSIAHIVDEVAVDAASPERGNEIPIMEA